MTTLAIMKARIASELARGSSLTTQIADAITTAITAYQKYRFRWNESRPSVPVTFNTVAGTSYYTASQISSQTIFRLDYVTVVIGTEVVKLHRVAPIDVRLRNDGANITGQPDSFAYEGEELMISPIPDAVYTLTLGGVFSYPAPASDDEPNNRWMLDGEKLIRSRAKFEIATHVTRNDTMARAMSPDEHDDGKPMGEARRAFDELIRERNQIIATGRFKPTAF